MKKSEKNASDNCPRCKGVLGSTKDMYGIDIFCRMCGWHFNPTFDLSEEERKLPRIRSATHRINR